MHCNDRRFCICKVYYDSPDFTMQGPGFAFMKSEEGEIDFETAEACMCFKTVAPRRVWTATVVERREEKRPPQIMLVEPTAEGGVGQTVTLTKTKRNLKTNVL